MKKGFTLTEMLVAISILAVLTLIAIPSTIKIYEQSIKKNMITQENNIRDSAKIYIKDYCTDPIDSQHLSSCPAGFTTGIHSTKYICLNDTNFDEYINGDVLYKKEPCDGIVIFKESISGSGEYDDIKTFLFCDYNTSTNQYNYITDLEKPFDLSGLCNIK